MSRYWSVPLLALAVVVALCVGGCCGLGALLRLYGYTELKPPSTLLQPGAMVYVRSHNPFVAGIICSPKESLGDAWRPTESRTSTSQTSRMNGQKFDLEAKAWQAIQGEAIFSNVRGLTASFENAKLVELEDTDVINNLRYRSAACTQAVEMRRAQGFEITMVASGLMGDVTYKVTWDANATLSAEATAEALTQLAGKVGGSISHNSSNEVSAAGLMWGIKDDAYLAAVTVPGIDETAIPRGTQLIPTHETPIIANHTKTDACLPVPEDRRQPQATPTPTPSLTEL